MFPSSHYSELKASHLLLEQSQVQTERADSTFVQVYPFSTRQLELQPSPLFKLLSSHTSPFAV